jgi:tRNA-specific 2-thiouridylase
MSGGVDSSVAAARLMSQGYEVVGVTLHLWDYPDETTPKSRCCAPEDIHDAARVAAHLGFPHYAFDRREMFNEKVVVPFVDQYLAGTTPSPCVTCNQTVKFGELIRIADRLGCTLLATGHYARVVRKEHQFELHRGLDTTKDQSYFLYALSSEQLAQLRFPLGESHKSDVRNEALSLGLPGATKGESQELCFVQTGQYDKFIEERARDRIRPGRIVQNGGRVLGEHSGVHQFTLGQRKNLGVATGQRTYVTALDTATAEVTLGEQSELSRDWAELDNVQLAADISAPRPVDCMVRYRGQLHASQLLVHHGHFRVHFGKPVGPVVPGQFAVFFQEDRVIGGGKICATGRHPAPSSLSESP